MRKKRAFLKKMHSKNDQLLPELALENDPFFEHFWVTPLGKRGSKNTPNGVPKWSKNGHFMPKSCKFTFWDFWQTGKCPWAIHPKKDGFFQKWPFLQKCHFFDHFSTLFKVGQTTHMEPKNIRQIWPIMPKMTKSPKMFKKWVQNDPKWPIFDPFLTHFCPLF